MQTDLNIEDHKTLAHEIAFAMMDYITQVRLKSAIRFS